MIKSKKQSLIVIGVFTLVLALVTTTYAFFNYTRTGTANTIRTGRISFNTSQSNTLNLTNVFPMSETDAGNANLDAVSVRIWGDTTYADGEEYEISIVDVNNTIGSGASAKTIPINYIASYTATPVQSGDPNVIGESSNSYFTARGQSSPVYQLSATGEATNGKQVLVGFIPSGATGIDGTLTIKAYLDSSKIAISDTYNASDPETDTNGTTTEWVAGRTVLTTSEWNSIRNTPISFKIRVESNEGTWVEDPNPPIIPTIDSCPECKYIYTTNTYYYDGVNQSTLTTFANNNEMLLDDYNNVLLTSGKNFFLGFKVENDIVVKAYVCGIKINNQNQEIPFCVEGSTDGSTFDSNKNLILGETLWNDPELSGNECEVVGLDNGISCGEYKTNVFVDVYLNGSIGIFTNGVFCNVNNDGSVGCEEY